MFEQLIVNSSDAQSLGNFISSNQLLIDEFINSSIENQRQQENLFQQFVLLNSRVQIMDSLVLPKVRIVHLLQSYLTMQKELMQLLQQFSCIRLSRDIV